LLILLIILFSTCIARLTGTRGAIAVDLVFLWLFARLVARALMFPGSLKLFQRSTEANYRTEIARHYIINVRQLWMFLRHAAHLSDHVRGVTLDGLEKACAAVNSLACSLRTQEQHEVRLTAEQREVLDSAEDLGQWLHTLQVQSLHPRGQGSVTLPLGEWLAWARQEASRSRMPQAEFIGRSELDAQGALPSKLARLERLLSVMEDLKAPKSGMLTTAMRFLKVPTVGSLNQLRAELQIHYSGQHFWVKTKGGHRLDAMFIPCQRGHRLPEEVSNVSDQLPLNEGHLNPTLIWCNPNAAYYEAMVYQAGILKFWANQGCNLFLFNYAGYGRSSGQPSPSRVAEDGEAVVNFLKSRGVAKLGIYGRSIGGIAACHLARRFPEVQILITDRTMSTLEGAAQCMYGGWAAKGLRVTSMVADNTENFVEVRCHKLLICDPRDTMILELASLRTAVALQVLERVSHQERLNLDDATLNTFAEAWCFFDDLFALCEGEEDLSDRFSGRPARQVVVQDSVRVKAENADAQSASRGGACGNAVAGGPAFERVGTTWLEDNVELVRSALAPFEDQLHHLLEVVCEGIEGGGQTLGEVLETRGNLCHALRCLLANMQVWRATGNPRAEGCDFAFLSLGQEIPSGLIEIDSFLSKDEVSARQLGQTRLAEMMSLHPDSLAQFHRHLARARVTVVWREFRRRQSVLQGALGNLRVQGNDAAQQEQLDRLVRTIILNLDEIGSFVSTLAAFFKSVDLAEVSENPVQGEPRPVIDRSMAGYVMHVDCGHNGPLDEVDLRQLSLHLRVSKFGREEV